MQSLDDQQDRLARAASRQFRGCSQQWEQIAASLMRLRPARQIAEKREALMHPILHGRTLARIALAAWRGRTANLAASLKLLGPEQVLARGYSITVDAKTGTVVRRAESVHAGQQLRTRLRDGEVISRVESTTAGHGGG